jgi:serine/threonine protein kinase
VGNTQEAVLPVGHLFAGRYRIKSFLGEGDRKRTYLADDTVFPREVALALIKRDAALSDPEGTRCEAKALALAGRNDNVVTFHDSGTAEGTEYLVFGYLSGGNLGEYLAKQGAGPAPHSRPVVGDAEPVSRPSGSGVAGSTGVVSP